MVITIKKMKQPVNSSYGKKGFTFYRVKRDGEYLNDFKTKAQAVRYVKRLRKK